MKEDMIKIAQLCFTSGLVDGCGGNISCRSTDRNDFLISRTGCCFGTLQPSDIIIYSDDKSSSSKEAYLHELIYIERQDINAILHLHPVFSVISNIDYYFQISRRVQKSGIVFGGKVDLLAPGSNALAIATQGKFADERTNIVVQDEHGVLVGGKNLQEAFNIAHSFEYVCKQIYFNLLSGEKL